MQSTSVADNPAKMFLHAVDAFFKMTHLIL